MQVHQFVQSQANQFDWPIFVIMRYKKKHRTTTCVLSPAVDLSSRFGDEDSLSTLTFQHSLSLVHFSRPKSFCIEMIWKASVRLAFLKAIRECVPMYALWSGVINSACIELSSRTRFYICGVDVTQVGSYRFGGDPGP